MSTQRTAPEGRPARHRQFRIAVRPSTARGRSGLIWGLAPLGLLLHAGTFAAQAPTAAPARQVGEEELAWVFAPLRLLLHAAPLRAHELPVLPAGQLLDEEMILSVKANGQPRGEFALRRRADGDFWVPAADLPRLQVEPDAQARRSIGGESYYSIRALGGASLHYEEADLALSVMFPVQGLQGTRIDLSSRPPRSRVEEGRTSLILSYRVAARHADAGATEYLAATDINLRWNGLLLRQEARVDTSPDVRRVARGRTQAIYDDAPNARRYVGGDVLSTAGAYGSAITGAGLQLIKLYALTPDVVTQPTATFHTSAALPSQVEVAVDGATISRTSVGPGPVTVSNLLLNGGARTVRVTVTDASGRREVIERPFLFTESVLAEGLHEYAYFAGKRSELASDDHWRYLENAWQGFHRYGASDVLTLAAGGEGNPYFSNGGAGITLRSDRFGLFSADVLGSRDRRRDTTAAGWSARYTYTTPGGTLILGRRQFQQGFQTFATSALVPFLRRETRIGVTTAVWGASLAADLVRSEDAREVHDTAIVRINTQLTRRVNLSAEYQTTRVNGARGWAANVFLRTQLDGDHWVATSARGSPGLHSLDLETGKPVAQGEGFGYRVGTGATRADGSETALAYAAANWNLRAAGLEVAATQPVRGNGAQFAEVAMTGAVVGVDGRFGLARHVNDSFVLAQLGVPLAGVDVYLNNQLQGKTDAEGKLFIADVGAFGRQDVSLNERQVPMEYNLEQRRRTITPAFRSGSVVHFGGTRMRAVAGMAWQLQAGGARTPIVSRALALAGASGRLSVETTQSGDFYLEHAPPGHYAGSVEIGTRTYHCRVDVPDFAEAVHELKEGILCE